MAIKQELQYCRKCRRQTIHMKNGVSISAMAWFIHIIMTLLTAGVWLIVLFIHLASKTSIGGWKCTEEKNDD